jgi:hypothetical protein
MELSRILLPTLISHNSLATWFVSGFVASSDRMDVELMRCAGAIKGSCRETVLRRVQNALQAPPYTPWSQCPYVMC